jgi:hypothetical protein
MGAALCARPRFKPYQILLAWLGGFTPDASIFIMVAYSRFADVAGASLWSRAGGLYWQEPWQFFSAVSNSIPMWILFCAVGFAIFKKSTSLKSVGLAVLIFSSATLVHVMVDFLTHASDAHVHFWPLTDWRFHSPVSYYERAFYGRIVGLFEVAMGLGIIVYLVTRFKYWPVRILAVLLGLPYLVSLYFIF